MVSKARRRYVATGGRRLRWIQSHQTSGGFFVILTVFFLLGVNGWVSLPLAGLSGWMAYMDFKDAKRGWLISYKIPKRARRQSLKKGIAGEVARLAIEDTEREAKNPGRRRYSFERPTKPQPVVLK